MEVIQELIDVLICINETLSKIERNQRYYTKVVLGTRAPSMSLSEANKLTPEQLSEFGGGND